MRLINKYALELLKNDGVIVAPSVTNYGVFCSATSASGIARIFKMKERTKFGPLTLGIGHPNDVRTYADIPPEFSDALIAELLLGKVTTVFFKAPAATLFPEQMTMGAPTVGLFCHGMSPMYEIGRDFGPIALTSSNISGTGGHQDRGPLEELKARILLANPHLFGRITTDSNNCSLTINRCSFRIHFRDLDGDLDDLGYFDLTVLATSRQHIRSQSYLDKLESISRVVIGVAENPALPALYPALLTANSQHFLASRTAAATELSGSYAMGSCQCVGWTTGLRILADSCANRGVALHDILIHTEIDIVHPDTASSNFGTKRVGSRTEDPRDNLRPGVSQVAESMLRFSPATSSNSVSLRVLTQPPGYQVQRFFLHGLDIRTDDIIDAAKALESAEPCLIHVTNSPIGSRCYAFLPCSIVLLATEQHISVKRIGDIVEVVMQAFVHNTLGYCAAILSATDRILRGDAVTFIDSHNQLTIKEKNDNFRTCE